MSEENLLFKVIEPAANNILGIVFGKSLEGLNGIINGILTKIRKIITASLLEYVLPSALYPYELFYAFFKLMN